MLDMESNLTIMKTEFFKLPLPSEELAKFQALKKTNSVSKEHLSPTQNRLINIIKSGDEEFIRALSNAVNGFVLLRKSAEKAKVENKN
jgi:hypothetical protein